MNLKVKIISDLKNAMKSGDVFCRDVLRFLDSAIKNVEIEKKKREVGLSDEEVVEVVARSIKQRKDSVEQYRSGGREDLAEKEEKEIGILMSYMPEQLSEGDVRKIIQEIIIQIGLISKSDMGKVMGQVMGKLKGKADGNLVKKIVDEELK